MICTPKYFHKSQEFQVRDYSPAKRKATLRRAGKRFTPSLPPYPLQSQTAKPRERCPPHGRRRLEWTLDPRDPKARYQANPQSLLWLPEGSPESRMPAVFTLAPAGSNGPKWISMKTSSQSASTNPDLAHLMPASSSEPGTSHSPRQLPQQVLWCQAPYSFPWRKKPIHPGGCLLSALAATPHPGARLLQQPRQCPWTRYPGGAHESRNWLTPANSSKPVWLWRHQSLKA